MAYPGGPDMISSRRISSQFVCLKLRCCFTAVPMLVRYSDGCVVIQVSKMWSM